MKLHQHQNQIALGALLVGLLAVGGIANAQTPTGAAGNAVGGVVGGATGAVGGATNAAGGVTNTVGGTLGGMTGSAPRVDGQAQGSGSVGVRK